MSCPFANAEDYKCAVTGSSCLIDHMNDGSSCIRRAMVNWINTPHLNRSQGPPAPPQPPGAACLVTSSDTSHQADRPGGASGPDWQYDQGLQPKPVTPTEGQR